LSKNTNNPLSICFFLQNIYLITYLLQLEGDFMYQHFSTIQENQTYIGDLVDFNGRRIALIVNKGIAVFAQCPMDKHYVFQDDFEALANTLDFVWAAKIEQGQFQYNEELDRYFDSETIELIYHYLRLSLALND